MGEKRKPGSEILNAEYNWRKNIYIILKKNYYKKKQSETVSRVCYEIEENKASTRMNDLVRNLYNKLSRSRL